MESVIELSGDTEQKLWKWINLKSDPCSVETDTNIDLNQKESGGLWNSMQQVFPKLLHTMVTLLEAISY